MECHCNHYDMKMWSCRQECPRCRSTIEKDGGCNHMVCKRCKYDFCWICLTPWEPHGSSWSVDQQFVFLAHVLIELPHMEMLQMFVKYCIGITIVYFCRAVAWLIPGFSLTTAVFHFCLLCLLTVFSYVDFTGLLLYNYVLYSLAVS